MGLSVWAGTGLEKVKEAAVAPDERLEGNALKNSFLQKYICQQYFSRTYSI